MKKRNVSDETKPRTWQMSFNDLLTVLLTFFILLVSISNIQADKVQDFSASASEALGARGRMNQKESLINAIGAIDGISVRSSREGIAVVLRESLLYRSGSAEIIHKDVLRQLGEKLKNVKASIRVEGHTDNIPVVSRSFPSNWELSTRRAVNVVKFFADECGIDPKKLSAAGYADSRPVAPNSHPEGRALNRRVNMIISLK
jgi:chemotaxis protein MotB